MIAFLILLLFILFYLLGKSADLVVFQIRSFGERFGVPLSFLGIILGLLTSIPELSIGIDALVENAVAISIGNLFGSIIVLFGLIYGGGIILNRKTKTDGRLWHIIPFFLYIILALVFGLTGMIDEFEGSILIIGYFVIIFFIYKKGKKEQSIHHHKKTPIPFAKSLLIILFGIAGIIIISKIIILLSLDIIKELHLPEFLVGLLIFSIGTNLPEIIVTLRSWRRHIRELSVANIYGSAIANIFIIGLLAFLRPIYVNTGTSYYIMMASFLALFVSILFFYKSEGKLTKNEGVVLVSLYVLSVLSEVFVFTIK